MARIAFFTFGILHEPAGHERVQGFVDLIDPVFNDVEEADGFIDRAKTVDLDDTKTSFERDYGKWGTLTTPRFYAITLNPDENTVAQTLSVWKDLQTVSRFSYQTLHAEALRGRKQWFIDPTYPSHVAWWIDDNHQPTWKDACERHEHLHDNGATPYAFDLRKPFDENGDSISLRKKKS